jgi:hypothetical protein
MQGSQQPTAETNLRVSLRIINFRTTVFLIACSVRSAVVVLAGPSDKPYAVDFRVKDFLGRFST